MLHFLKPSSCLTVQSHQIFQWVLLYMYVGRNVFVVNASTCIYMYTVYSQPSYCLTIQYHPLCFQMISTLYTCTCTPASNVLNASTCIFTVYSQPSYCLTIEYHPLCFLTVTIQYNALWHQSQWNCFVLFNLLENKECECKRTCITQGVLQKRMNNVGLYFM